MTWRHFSQLLGELEHACVRLRWLDFPTGEIMVKPDSEQVQPFLIAEIGHAGVLHLPKLDLVVVKSNARV